MYIPRLLALLSISSSILPSALCLSKESTSSSSTALLSASTASTAPLARSSSSSSSNEPSVIKKCPGNVPVHERSCTLDINKGEAGEFMCMNPLPQHFPSTVYTWDGEESKASDVFGGGTTIQLIDKKKHLYRIYIPNSSTAATATAAAAGVTCSQAVRTPGQPTNDNPSLDSAEYLQIHSLVIRLNGGPPYAQEFSSSGGSSSSNSSMHATLLWGLTTLITTLVFAIYH